MQTPTKGPSTPTRVVSTPTNISSPNAVSNSQELFPLRKDRIHRDLQILDFPPTTLTITTHEGNKLNPDEIDKFLEKNRGEDAYIDLVSLDSSLRIQQKSTEPRTLYLSFKESNDKPLDEKTIPYRDINSPGIENPYIVFMNKITQQNDVKTGLREKDNIPRKLYRLKGIVNVRYSKEYYPQVPINLIETTVVLNNGIRDLNVPIITIPAGSYLYRGISDKACTRVSPRHIRLQYFSFFTVEPDTATSYANFSNCVEIYKVTKDIQLVDFWNKEFIEDFLILTDEEKKLFGIFFGTSEKSENFLDNLDNRRYYKSVFPGGEFKTDPATATKYFEYKGLKWGPEIGQYKRNSQHYMDNGVYELLIKTKIPKELDGIYCVDVPSHEHSNIISNENPVYISKFHSEVILRLPAVVDKISLIARKQLGNYLGSGKRRKTYRKKKNKRKTKRSNRLSSKS